MNNDNELMKEFNETFGDKQEPVVEPYHTVQNTQNLNMINQENNMVNQNIQNNTQNMVMPDFVNQNSSVNVVPEVNNTVIVENSNNNVNSINNQVQNNPNLVDVQTPIQNNINSEQQLYNTTNYINDSTKPVEKKAKKATIQINPELKTAIILAVVLLIAMAFIPTLFDLFDSLKLKIFG